MNDTRWVLTITDKINLINDTRWVLTITDNINLINAN